MGNIRTFCFLIGNWSVIFSGALYKNPCIHSQAQKDLEPGNTRV